MSEEQKNGPEEADKSSKKRKHDEETAAINIPSTSSQSANLPAWVAGNSPVRFIDPEELLNMSVAMDNLALVHEIAVDPQFRIENVSINPIEQAVRENMYRAYWDLLKEDLAKEPPSYEQAFKLLMEIKQEIVDSLLSERHIRLKTEINMIMNEEQLRTQLNEKTLNVKAVSLFILEFLSRLCCPERDEMIEKLRNEDGIVELISGIFRLIDTMKNDLTNYAISKNRKQVEEHSAKMELATYMKYLENFPDGSKLTRAWLEKAYSELHPTSEPDAKKEKDDEEVDEYMAVTARAYVNLLREVNAEPFPETLRIDQARFLTHAYKILQCILTTAGVLVTCNVAGKEIAEAKDFKATLKNHLFALADDLNTRGVAKILDDFSVQAAKDAKDQAAQLNLTLTEEQEESIKRQVLALEKKDNPVRSLVHDRVAAFMEQILRNPSGSARLAQGTSIIEKDLCVILARVLRLASYNRKTFEAVYRTNIAKIRAEAGEGK